MFTWRWETPSRWGNLLRWGNPPVHIISLLICSCLNNRWGDPPHVTSPIWGLPTPCKRVFSGSLLDSYTMFAFLSVSPTKFHNGHPEERKRPIQKSFPLYCREVWQESMYGLFVRRDRAILFYTPIPPPPLSPPSRWDFYEGSLARCFEGLNTRREVFLKGGCSPKLQFLKGANTKNKFLKG